MVLTAVIITVSFLVWAEIIPIRKWYYATRARAMGGWTRFWIEVLDFLFA